MTHYKFIIVSLFFLGFSNAKAQEILTLEIAVKLALDANFLMKERIKN